MIISCPSAYHRVSVLILLTVLCAGFSSLQLVAADPGREPPAISGQQAIMEITELNQKAEKLRRAGKYFNALPLALSALKFAENTVGPEHLAVAESLSTLAGIYQDDGEYRKAEPLYLRALTIRGKVLGPKDPDVAINLTNLADLYFSIGEYGKVETLLLRALVISEGVLGSEDPEVATILNSLAELYQSSGEYGKVEPLLKRGLAIQERFLGPDHPNVARSLNNLGVFYQVSGDYAKAEPLYQRALTIREKTWGSEHPDVATSLNNLAGLHYARAELVNAETLLRRALAIRQKTLRPQHPDVGTSLNNLAGLHYARGEYEKVEPLLQQALAIREKALGTEHPYVAATLTNMAVLHYARGEYEKVEPLLLRVLTVREKVLGPDHPGTAETLGELGDFYLAVGKIGKGEPLYRRALAIQEKVLGSDHPNVATILNSQGRLYRLIGDYGKSEPLYRRALAIREKALGPDHPEVANTLNDLAGLFRDKREYAQAEPLYRRALEIRGKVLGPTHTELATTANNLALLYQATGEYTKAVPLCRRALAIQEKVLGPDHPGVAAILNNLGVLYRATGQYENAEVMLRRALAIWEKVLGPEHPDVAAAVTNLAVLAIVQRRYRSAVDLYKRGHLLQERAMRDVFAFTTEEQKLKFINVISGDYFVFLSLIQQHLKADHEVVRDGLELVLRRKGVVFDAQANTMEKLKGQLSEPARKELERYSVLISERARLLLQKTESMSPEMYRAKLALLDQRIEESDRRLARESPVFAEELQQRTVTIEAVKRNLPTESALVEFVKIRDYDFVRHRRLQSWRYLAFVLTSTGDVSLVDLGQAAKLETMVRGTLEAIRFSMDTRGIQIVKKQDAQEEMGRSTRFIKELSANLWVPLEASLKDHKKILLSPDGALNLVPFSALVDATGRSLVERVQLAYVTAGRELLRNEELPRQPGSDLLLVANPSFDQNVLDSKSRGGAFRSRDFQGRFTPFPGTEREGREIPPLIGRHAGLKQVLVGEQATERTVKSTRSPRILHLATHGFFLEDEPTETNQSTDVITQERGISVEMQGTSRRYENPLVRSGLALAGANYASEILEGEDGILTAFEITAMDLSGTELVVLSACDTGVGEVKNGEGVFGLRRAFALAGAKNLMMSLWPVSDEITANQMKAFYQNLQKLPPAEALRQAQLETIKELKAKYDGIAPPGLWAPFILQGGQALGQ